MHQSSGAQGRRCAVPGKSGESMKYVYFIICSHRFERTGSVVSIQKIYTFTDKELEAFVSKNDVITVTFLHKVEE
jgi:hypothetical protein